jgi:hypothetical protein
MIDGIWRSLRFALVLVAAASFGCSTSGTGEVVGQSNEVSELRSSLQEREQALREQQSRISELERELVERTDVAAAPPGMTARGGGDLFPPDARPGECYARVFVPASYETATEQVLAREASSRVEIIPAQYETVEERVLVKEASTRIEEVPATYENVTETGIVEPARTLWRLGSTSKAATADSTLLEEARKLGAPIDDARPGQCLAEYLEPEVFETRQEQVLAREASSRVEIVPARYEMVEERVLVSEASEKLVEVPAVYETVQERILIKPAHTAWKKGRGPIERVDDATGEIMCLVEVPAEYRTVSKRVLKSPATTRSVTIPAEYKTVQVRKLASPAGERKIEIPAEYGSLTKRDKVRDANRSWRLAGADGPGKATGRRLCMAEIPAKTRKVTHRVTKTPAATRTVTIPAEYKTVKVRKLRSKASERKIEIPAEYASISKRRLVKDGHLAWREILCETNVSSDLVVRLQRALDAAGHSPGTIDGVYGAQTLAAVTAYQKKKGLPSGQLTLRTLESLGMRQ